MPATVLFIDDDEGQLHSFAASARSFGELTVRSSTPADLDLDQLDNVSLVLMDLELGLEKSAVLNAPDGIALCSVIRRRLYHRKRRQPLGFAVLTSQPEGLAHPLPDTQRRPLLAAQHNLEWVFLKDDSNLVARIASLTRAVEAIPKQWEDGIDDSGQVATQLGISGAKDSERAWEAVERFTPPIYEFTQWSHGLAFIRWLAHTALPYPTFLWDAHQVAARWRVTYQSFSKAYSETKLKDWLRSAEYSGVLSDFLGRRWWRHRVEQMAWDATQGDAQNSRLLRKILEERAGSPLEATKALHPIVAIDGSAQPLDEFITMDSAARVQPDGWPASSEIPWMPLELLGPGSPLRKLVIDEDRSKLPS